MASAKAMGLGMMVLLLIVICVLFPIIVRYLNQMEAHFVISGFQDLGAQAQATDAPSSAPSIPSIPSTPYTRKQDPNTDYLCRSPNGSGQPCPEGTFCNGVTQSCEPLYVGGEVPSEGYFA